MTRATRAARSDSSTVNLPLPAFRWESVSGFDDQVADLLVRKPLGPSGHREFGRRNPCSTALVMSASVFTATPMALRPPSMAAVALASGNRGLYCRQSAPLIRICRQSSGKLRRAQGRTRPDAGPLHKYRYNCVSIVVLRKYLWIEFRNRLRASSMERNICSSISSRLIQ